MILRAIDSLNPLNVSRSLQWQDVRGLSLHVSKKVPIAFFSLHKRERQIHQTCDIEMIIKLGILQDEILWTRKDFLVWKIKQWVDYIEEYATTWQLTKNKVFYTVEEQRNSHSQLYKQSIEFITLRRGPRAHSRRQAKDWNSTHRGAIDNAILDSSREKHCSMRRRTEAQNRRFCALRSI